MKNKNVASIEKEHMETLVTCLNHLNSSGYTKWKKNLYGWIASTEAQRSFDYLKLYYYVLWNGEALLRPPRRTSEGEGGAGGS